MDLLTQKKEQFLQNKHFKKIDTIKRNFKVIEQELFKSDDLVQNFSDSILHYNTIESKFTPLSKKILKEINKDTPVYYVSLFKFSEDEFKKLDSEQQTQLLNYIKEKQTNFLEENNNLKLGLEIDMTRNFTAFEIPTLQKTFYSQKQEEIRQDISNITKQYNWLYQIRFTPSSITKKQLEKFGFDLVATSQNKYYKNNSVYIHPLGYVLHFNEKKEDVFSHIENFNLSYQMESTAFDFFRDLSSNFEFKKEKLIPSNQNRNHSYDCDFTKLTDIANEFSSIYNLFNEIIQNHLILNVYDKNHGGEDYFNKLTRLILHLKLSDNNIILQGNTIDEEDGTYQIINKELLSDYLNINNDTLQNKAKELQNLLIIESNANDENAKKNRNNIRNLESINREIFLLNNDLDVGHYLSTRSELLFNLYKIIFENPDDCLKEKKIKGFYKKYKKPNFTFEDFLNAEKEDIHYIKSVIDLNKLACFIKENNIKQIKNSHLDNSLKFPPNSKNNYYYYSKRDSILNKEILNTIYKLNCAEDISSFLNNQLFNVGQLNLNILAGLHERHYETVLKYMIKNNPSKTKEILTLPLLNRSKNTVLEIILSQNTPLQIDLGIEFLKLFTSQELQTTKLFKEEFNNSNNKLPLLKTNTYVEEVNKYNQFFDTKIQTTKPLICFLITSIIDTANQLQLANKNEYLEQIASILHEKNIDISIIKTSSNLVQDHPSIIKLYEYYDLYKNNEFLDNKIPHPKNNTSRVKI